MGTGRPWRDVRVVLAIVAGYLAASAWALTLTVPHTGVSLIWLPDGVLLGALVVLPLRLWGPTLGVLIPLALLVETLTTGRPLTMIAGFLIANLGESVGGALILRRAGGAQGIDDFRKLGIFWALCVALVPAAGALVGAATLVAHAPHVSFWHAFLTWFSAVSVGVVLVAPVIIHAYLELTRGRWTHAPSRTCPEHWALLLSAAGLSTATCLVPEVSALPAAPVFAAVPVLVWGVVRRGMWGALTAGGIIVLTLVHWTVAGFGPYAGGPVAISQLQVLMGGVILTSMFLAVAVEREWAAQAALRAAGQRFQALFDHAPVSLWEEDFSEVRDYLAPRLAEGPEALEAWLEANPEEVRVCARKVRVLRVNARTLELFEATSVQELLRGLPAIFEESTRAVFRRELVAMARGQALFRAEAVQRTLRGRTLQTLTNVAVAPDAWDTWARVYVAVEDVTAQRAAERALRRTQKMQAVQLLASGLAHDFNNSLSVIQLNLALVGPLAAGDPTLSSCVEESSRAVERAATLTRQLVALSRGERLGADERVDVCALVRRAEVMLRRSLPADVEVALALPEGAVWAKGGAAALEDALLNLALNAGHAMPNGGRLTVSLVTVDVGPGHSELAPGRYARLAVSDTGVGIPPEALDRVIEPFFTTKPPGEGSGLGLAMVYMMVGRLGGTMQIESTVGEGTRVILYLPLADVDQAAAQARAVR